MKKILLIYYSHGGTTKHLAEELKNELNLGIKSEEPSLF